MLLVELDRNLTIYCERHWNLSLPLLPSVEGLKVNRNHWRGIIMKDLLGNFVVFFFARNKTWTIEFLSHFYFEGVLFLFSFWIKSIVFFLLLFYYFIGLKMIRIPFLKLIGSYFYCVFQVWIWWLYAFRRLGFGFIWFLIKLQSLVVLWFMVHACLVKNHDWPRPRQKCSKLEVLNYFNLPRIFPICI